MKHATLWIILGALLVLPATHLAAEGGSGVGIVKGTITISGKATADAVVSVEGISSEQAKAQLSGSKPKKALMDQREMKFIPRVLAVVVGTTVEFPNNDNTWHNVYSKGGAKDFDLGLYPPGKTRGAKFDKPGVSKVLCNAHPNMEAFIVVNENPYFSAADQRGNYRIDRIPLAKYRVVVWHPELGSTESMVELVREGEVLDINFDLKKK